MVAIDRNSVIKNCFISAPAEASLNVLRESVKSHGLHLLVPQDLSVGSDWVSEIRKQLSQADLVIGVLTSPRRSSSVFFELGYASALGCRILLINTPDAEPIPFSLHQSLVLRIDLENRDAIDFALDQLLSAPKRPQAQDATNHRHLAALGSKADDLISSLDHSIDLLRAHHPRAGFSLEQIVADAIRSSGADLVVEAETHVRRADLAVWSDVLEPFVGNPLLIEVKARIRGKSDAQHAFQQVGTLLGTSDARWALLLFAEGPNSDEVWSDCPPNVLVFSIRSLLESLRTRAFPEVIRDARNKRVHGLSS